jgi:RNA polymerase-binding transcription factor DksA
MLLAMHDHFVSQINSLKNHSLERVDPIDLMEDGTDAFDRQFALSVAGSEQETVAEIDNALRRLEEGVYGVCEGCGCLVGRERLWALPFTRLCVKCQSEAERMRPRYRPFGN